MCAMNEWRFDKSSEELLENLVAVPAPSGEETFMAGFIRDRFKGREGVDVRTDALGNVYVSLRRGSSPSIGLVAHIDSVALQVTQIVSSGMFRFRVVGNVLPHVLLGQRVLVLTESGTVEGVVGFDQTSQFGQPKGLVEGDLWIDVYYDDSTAVHVGDFAVMKPWLRVNDSGYICGTSLDDRIGVFAVLLVMERIIESDVHANLHCIFSTQEEISLRGASVIAGNCEMDAALIVDVDYATDTPVSHPEQTGALYLGKGAGLNRKADNNISLFQRVRHVANFMNIPTQISVGRFICRGTDASVLQITGKGVATMNVNIPCRYMHSPVEVCHVHDVEAVVTLLTESVKWLTENDKNSFVPGIDR